MTSCFTPSRPIPNRRLQHGEPHDLTYLHAPRIQGLIGFGAAHAGVSAVVHPSGWLALSLPAGAYQRLGLTGHRVSGPKHQRNLSAARRARGSAEYAVLVKLKGLRTRPKQHGRVVAAFARLQEPLAWQLVFIDRGVPTVRLLCVDLCTDFSGLTPEKYSWQFRLFHGQEASHTQKKRRVVYTAYRVGTTRAACGAGLWRCVLRVSAQQASEQQGCVSCRTTRGP